MRVALTIRAKLHTILTKIATKNGLSRSYTVEILIANANSLSEKELQTMLNEAKHKHIDLLNNKEYEDG